LLDEEKRENFRECERYGQAINEDSSLAFRWAEDIEVYLPWLLPRDPRGSFSRNEPLGFIIATCIPSPMCFPADYDVSQTCGMT